MKEDYEVRSARLTVDGLFLEVMHVDAEGTLMLRETLEDKKGIQYEVIESYYDFNYPDTIYKVFRKPPLYTDVSLTSLVNQILTLKE